MRKGSREKGGEVEGREKRERKNGGGE